jgi:hypothetical protein
VIAIWMKTRAARVGLEQPASEPAFPEVGLYSGSGIRKVGRTEQASRSSPTRMGYYKAAPFGTLQAGPKSKALISVIPFSFGQCHATNPQ